MKRLCQQCERKITGEGVKFCSHRCAAEAMRVKRSACEECGKPVKRAKARLCSHRCTAIVRSRPARRAAEAYARHAAEGVNYGT